MFTSDDARYMARALELAQRGTLTTAPNPRVGCVIVKDGQIIGEGFHIRAGGPHAEVHALRAAGEQARGATAYVTLEPCSHYGRTPPCSQALIDAGVARVVAAMVDPNPQVAGRGLNMLKAAGIDVAHGLMAAEAEQINLGFMKRMRTGFPYVRIKLAASLDGKTALSNGQSKWITGPKARSDVQRLRAMSDAIITGADSVLIDDPSMNVRHSELGHWQSRIDEAQLQQPLRVVIDGQARLAPPLKLLDCSGDILLASLNDYAVTWPAHVATWRGVDNGHGKLDLIGLMLELAKRQINEVLIEAGPSLAGAFMMAGLCDELWLYQAPKIMGNASGDLLNLPEFTSMAQVPKFTIKDLRTVGSDLRLILTPSY